MNTQTLLKTREREAAELQKLHEGFRGHRDYTLAVKWREQRIANVNWHLARAAASQATT